MIGPQLSSIFGVRITVSEHAMKRVPLFPEKKWTKRRRRRVIGKYGRWSENRPAAWMIGNGAIMHPVLYAQLKKEN